MLTLTQINCLDTLRALKFSKDSSFKKLLNYLLCYGVEIIGGYFSRSRKSTKRR
jgi:hypothetical protein